MVPVSLIPPSQAFVKLTSISYLMLRILGPLSFKNRRMKICKLWGAILPVAVLARRHLVVIWWPPITCNAEPPCAASFTLGVMSGVGWRGSPRWHGIRLIVQEGLEDPFILLDEVSSTGCLDCHCIIWFVRKKKYWSGMYHCRSSKQFVHEGSLVAYFSWHKTSFEIFALLGCDAA